MSPKRDLVGGPALGKYLFTCFSLSLVTMVLTCLPSGSFPEFGLNELKNEFQ